jgi:putative phosphoserine phosphatase/1-acylglycerol-3-phosphate O-acyltransferase
MTSTEIAPTESPGTKRAQPRLPGTVAEIEASPKGSQIGAFFDFDGTLISGFSAGVFTNDRLRRRDIGVGEIARLVRFGIEAGLGAAEFADLLQISAESMRGRAEEDIAEIGERLFVQKIADRVYPEARDLVAAHARRGHTVVLLSSATRYQIGPVARDLGVEHVVCNEFEVDDGMFTGAIRAPIVWGETKAEVAQRFAAEHGVDPARSYFYADGNEDVAFMYLVGQPRPTNPRSGLEKVARKRGWPVLRFSSRGSVGPVGVVRNLLGVAAIAPAGAVGLVVGLATRNRRTGVNFLLKRWVDTLFATTGVRLNVQGEEHLWSHRPAVFIFNHRNNFDVFMAGRLVERDYTSVGKKELASNPLAAGIGKLVDAVFIDRTDTKSAVEALAPVQEAVRKGLSLIVSPEGTRSAGRDVGQFKKGPFRIAMAAGVPIVPIVIRNADEIAPRNASLMRSGTVDMCVLPPIPTEAWTVENLSHNIAEVRRQFVDTLADWPGRGD